MEQCERSKQSLVNVHPDLVRVVKRAWELAKADGVDFMVTEGCRTLARQRALVAAGASKTLKSRHLPGTGGVGHAIDFAPLIDGEVSWKWPAFAPIAACFKKAALELKVPIEWGGDWVSFKDGPHVQLPWKTYP